MTLSLKEAYQIKIAPSYTAADGKRFLDLAEAQTHTRDRMLESAIVLAIKQNPEFARLDKPLLKEFLLLSGAVVGQIMAEKLEPLSDTPNPGVTVTNTVRAGETEEQAAARLRRLVETSRTAPLDTPMPKTQNPDIFQNRHPALKAADAVDQGELDRDIQEALTRSVG